MANATVTSSFDVNFDDGIQNLCLKVMSRQKTSSGKLGLKTIQSVGHTDQEAIQLGDIDNIATLALVNLDTSNPIDVYASEDGIQIAKLLPDTNGDGTGGFLVIDRLGDGITAPFVEAEVAACRMAILIIDR